VSDLKLTPDELESLRQYVRDIDDAEPNRIVGGTMRDLNAAAIKLYEELSAVEEPVSGSVVDISQLIDEKVADVIRAEFPPGVINKAAMAAVKRQLALFWLGFADEDAIHFERLQMVSIGPGPNNFYRGVLEWDFNLMSMVDRKAISLHIAADERSAIGQKTRDLVENVTAERRYSIIFAQENTW
jgi:hypothetical protein